MGCGQCRQQGNLTNVPDVKLDVPLLLSDGAIQFPEGQVAPLIDGYTPDGKDKSRLIPDGDCVCAWKITGIMLQKDGEHKPSHVCRQSKCGHGTKPIPADICRACPLRELALDGPG